MIDFLLATDLPGIDDYWRPVALPSVLTLLGAILFWVLKSRRAKGLSAPTKWLGVAPMVVGAILGLGPFNNIRDPFYNSSVRILGDKTVWGHYGAFVIPVLGIVTLGLWHLLDIFAPQGGDDGDELE